MPVMGVKECLPWGYRRHWNEVWEISEQVIEGIPVFSPADFNNGDSDRYLWIDGYMVTVVTVTVFPKFV